MISQEQVTSKNNQQPFLPPKNQAQIIEIDEQSLNEDSEEVEQIIDQPFYEFEGSDDLPEEEKQKADLIQQNFIRSELSSIDNQTVEAVKMKLINDPEYRKNLLKRVLPQFAQLNDKFQNSFLYRLKYDIQTSSQPSIQKSNQSSVRNVNS